MARKTKPFNDVEELVLAMQDTANLPAEDDGAVTTKELARRMGWSDGKTIKHLHLLDAEGKIEPVKVIRTMMDGRRAKVSAYKIKVL